MHGLMNQKTTVTSLGKAKKISEPSILLVELLSIVVSLGKRLGSPSKY